MIKRNIFLTQIPTNQTQIYADILICDHLCVICDYLRLNELLIYDSKG